MSDKISETDGFWDVDAFLPPKKQNARLIPRDTEAVSVTLDADEDASALHGEKIRPASEAIPARGAQTEAKKPEPEMLEYDSDNPFIGHIKVLPWPARYSFYERFRRDALRYFSRGGSECEPVPFFSYMPQYIQLDASQRLWYFRFRDCARHGIFPKCDMSYILLYIFEIINLPDMIPARVGLERLCELWLAYRGDYPRLDRYLCEWVCDYCLINGLPAPTEKLSAIIPEIMRHSTFKEFYLSHGIGEGDDTRLAAMLVGYSSNYYYKNSKYITEENSELFTRHIPAAFVHAYKKLALRDKRFTRENEAVKVRFTRDAYLGALCAYDVKRRIEIEYYAFSRSPDMRIITTDIVKCAENNLRSYLGIRSRLSLTNTPSALADAIRLAVGEYFAENGLKRRNTRESGAGNTPETPDYEKLYEARTGALSTENALEIERRSWATTEKLADAFEDELIFSPPEPPRDEPTLIPAENAPANDAGVDEYALEREAFVCLLSGDEGGFKRLAEANNMLPDALVARLNEISYDIVGDITVEMSGGITLIEDYTEEIREWTNR